MHPLLRIDRDDIRVGHEEERPLAPVAAEARGDGQRLSLGGGQVAQWDATLDGHSVGTNRSADTAEAALNTPSVEALTEFTLDTILDPANMGLAAGIQAVLKEYRAVDDRTFVMVSNGPIASFLYDAPIFAVMPKHVWAGVAPADWPNSVTFCGLPPNRAMLRCTHRSVAIASIRA